MIEKGNPEIINRFTGKVIIEAGKYTNIKEAVEKSEADLHGADLRGANLHGADLHEADLHGANLHAANLRAANLRGADLHAADLHAADLYAANLRGADLHAADLYAADLRGANLREANLRGANLYAADLYAADLRGADLREADLHGADLHEADLRGANLREANLRGANLRGTKYKEPLFLTDLYLLKLQPSNTKLRAWKYLKGGLSPYQKFKYDINKTYEFDCDMNENILCSNGGNIATLTWCLKDNLEVDEFMEVEFLVKDIVMPLNSDGKFRVKKFTTLRIINREEAIKILTDAMKGEL